MPKSKPAYPAEFRQQIIELARAGKTPAQLAREFGRFATLDMVPLPGRRPLRPPPVP